MVQRAAGAAPGQDAPATRARQRTAQPAGSEAEYPGPRAQPRVTARRVRLLRTAAIRGQQPVAVRGAQHARDTPPRCSRVARTRRLALVQTARCRSDLQGRTRNTRDGRRSRSRTARRGCTARRDVWGPRTRDAGCAPSGSGIPPTGRSGGRRSSPGPGPPPPSSDDPGSEPGPRKSSSGARATSNSAQASPRHKSVNAACSLRAPASPTIQGRNMQMTSPANRCQNRERRRRVGSRKALMRTPRGIAASDRTITSPMTEAYCRPIGFCQGSPDVDGVPSSPPNSTSILNAASGLKRHSERAAGPSAVGELRSWTRRTRKPR
jgi:hypothetical protein